MPDTKDGGSQWNALEIAKVGISALTPILLFVLGVVVNQSVQSRQLSDARQAAVQNLSRFIWERQTRAELLGSALGVFTRSNVPLDEIIERKKLYDETYVKFNSNDQANLLLIRQLLPRDNAEFEKLFEADLVQKVFSPLDACLTSAYDARVGGQTEIKPILAACKAEELLNSGNDCGTAITDQLFRLVAANGDVAAAAHSAAKTIGEKCRSPLGQ